MVERDRHYRIAMIAACPFPFARGTPVRIHRMTESLARRGHEVHVVTYHLGDETDHPPFQLHRTWDVKYYRNCSPGPTYTKLFLLDPLLAVKIFQVLRRFKIDLIHAHHYEGLLVSLPAKKWTNIPLIYDAHTLLESELPFYKLGLSQKVKLAVGRLIDRRLPGYADHIIAVTSGIRAKLMGGSKIARDRISFITNGVEYDHFQVRASHATIDNYPGKTLIYTGNLATFQGIELMLRTFHKVRQQRTDVRLLLATASDFTPYEALTNTLGIREYIEIRSIDFKHLPTALAEANIALNPRSECDGIPQKLLNYMAAAKPIVSCAGSAKTIEHGKTGWIVNDNDIMDFANGILHLLAHDDLAQRLGAKAFQLASTDYSWEKTAEKVETVYHKLMAGERA